MAADKKLPCLSALIFVLTTSYKHPLASSTESLTEDWVALQARYCGKTCQNGTVVTSNLCSTLQCFPCDCKEHCHLLGTCCPSYNPNTDSYHYKFESSLEKNPHQWYRKVDCQRTKTTLRYESFLTVVECPDDWDDAYVRDNCENPQFDSLKSANPFSDTSTGLVFTNIYCVICHGLSIPRPEELVSKSNDNWDEDDTEDEPNPRPWKLMIDCIQYQTMYTITDLSEFFKVALKNRCPYGFSAPNETSLSLKYCGNKLASAREAYYNTLSESCSNSTDFLISLCHTLPPVPALIASGHRNMFCSLACNGSLPEPMKCPYTTSIGSIVLEEKLYEKLPPMFLLFSPDLGGIVTMDDAGFAEEVEECPVGTWRNDKGDCTTPVCASGKLLKTENNSTTCRTAIPDIRGLGYNVHFVLVAISEIRQNDISDVEYEIFERFRKMSSYIQLSVDFKAKLCRVRLRKEKENAEEIYYHKRQVEIQVTGFIIAPKSLSRDSFENESLEFLLQSEWDLSYRTISGRNKTQSLQLVSVGQDMTDLYMSLENPRRDFQPNLGYNLDSHGKRKRHIDANINADEVDDRTGKNDYNYNDQITTQARTNDKYAQSKTSIPMNYSMAKNQRKSYSHALKIIYYNASKSILKVSNLQTENGSGYSKQLPQNDFKDTYHSSQKFGNALDHGPKIFSERVPSSHNDFINQEPQTYPHQLEIGDIHNARPSHIVNWLQGDGRLESSPQHLKQKSLTSRSWDEYRNLRTRRSGLGKHRTVISKTSCFEDNFQWVPPRNPTSFLYIDDYRHVIKRYKNKFIDIVSSLRCPYIEVNLTSVSKLENGSLQFTIYTHDKEINITYITPVLSYRSGRLFVCLNFLKNLFSSCETDAIVTQPPSTASLNHGLVVEISYYTDIVCTSISILCLTLTFVTYCLFPSLRSLPGRNNMCLCASLAMAQITLLITSVFGTRGRIHDTHCLIHAMILHYSWLASFAWMNTCSIHMYRVFTSNHGPSAWSETKTHGFYCIYSFGIPLIIVITTVVITYAITSGDSIGYNDKICLLDVSTSPLISILALLTPFGLTMAINTVLFIRTIKEIAQVRRLQQNSLSNTSRNGVLTYFKLSTVTGLFWSLQAAAVFTSSPTLLLIATPFAGLQGLFIFASFTLNKTVSDLYKGLVVSRKSDENSRTVSGGSKSGKYLVKQTTVVSSV